MPKNKGKGGKNRRRGKKEDEEKRDLAFKEDGQEYGQVLRLLGNNRLEVYCFDGQKRLCHIPGKLRRRVWMNQGDIVLVGLRDFQDGKCDVILKYTADEARTLKAYGELPESARVNVDAVQNEEDDGVQVDFQAAGAGSGSDEEEEDDEEDEEEKTPPPPAAAAAAAAKPATGKPGAKPAAKPAAPTGKAAAAAAAPKAAAKKKPAASLEYDPLKPNPNRKANTLFSEDSDDE